MSVVDLGNGQVTSTIPAADGGSQIQLTRNQKFIYEVAESNYSLYLLDLATQQAIGVSVSLTPGNPSDIAVSSDGRLIYVTSTISSSLDAFSSNQNGTVVALGTIDLPSASDAVVFSPI